MTRIEYFRKNKKVFTRIFKILGIVFICILALILLIFGLNGKKEMIDGVYLFLFCFAFGTLFALSFLSLTFSLGYSQVKFQIDLYSKFLLN